MKLDSLTLALTAYNEEDALPRTVERALELLPQAAKRWELLIVDDGSTDGPAQVAGSLEVRHNGIRVLRHDQNRGMGAAIRTAIDASQMEWFCTIAADGQVDPRDLTTFLEPAQYCSAIFSTYSTRRDGIDRAFLSAGLRILLTLLTGAWNIPTGNYFIKTEILKSLSLHSNSFFANYEIYLSVRKRNIPYVWTSLPCTPRDTGKSKVRNLKTIFRVWNELVRYRFR